MVDDAETNPETVVADDALGALKPFAVPMKTAQELLGRKARSEVYEAIGRGELDAVKDGTKTLIVLASIERRQTQLPLGLAKPPDKATRAQRKKRAAGLGRRWRRDR